MTNYAEPGIIPVPMPWPAKQARELVVGAVNVSRHSTHADQIARDNCGACALRRYGDENGPNYAGWLRIYIQLGWRVPKKHYDAEIAYADAENTQYRHAISRDVSTWGIKFTYRASAVDAATVTK